METFVPVSELTEHAAACARSMAVTGRIPGRRESNRARQALAVLCRAEQELRRRSVRGEELSASGRWLWDNLYLARQAARDISRAFSSAGRLRAAGDRALISRACGALLASGDGEAEEERIGVFLDGFQKEMPLTRKERSLVAAGLEMAALGGLAEAYGAPAPDVRRCEVLFTALRRLGMLELRDVIDGADRTDRLLRCDPAGIYPRMDRPSREAYREELSRLAESFGMEETAAAQRVLDLAGKGKTPRERHVGTYILEQPLGQKTRRRSGVLRAWAEILPPIALSALTAWLLGSAWAGILALPGLMRTVRLALDKGTLLSVRPRQVPRMDLQSGVPAEGKTVCVISALLTGPQALDQSVQRLEELRLAEGAEENLLFGLLCDLPESDRAFTDADGELLSMGTERIGELNARYGGGFFLFCRDRRRDASGSRFMPWERKRGALLSLCRFLRQRESELQLRSGDRAALQGAAYVLTLDADTRPEPESLTALIAAALHPLNRPEIDPDRKIVVRGHGVLQPRLSTDLAASFRSGFTRLFSPRGGSDPYALRTGEVYMDLFDRSGFAGKGLLHIDVFLECLDGRFPEGRVLSHDALEGAYLRGGTVSDAVFSEGFPASPVSWLSRQHRWIRGDWQNLPWIGLRGRDLPFVERWRLLGALGRSLFPAGQLSAVGAFLLFPSPTTLPGAALSLACLLVDCGGTGLFPVRTFSDALNGAGDALQRALLRLALLPAEAWTALSAAVCALWRMGISHKNLLQWRTAEQTESAGAGKRIIAWRQMWFSAAWGAVLLAISPLPVGKALGAFWTAAPGLAALSGRTGKKAPPLTGADRDFLLRRGAELWRYFKENCVPEDHFLPPDNIQESPPAETARRVSPTNLGLALLSALCALKLELASRQEALGLCENLLTATERLEKWHGHLFNWYDNRTMAPLSPRYVSTVDSGNLAACLIAAAGAFRESGAGDLARRADALWRAMDFSVLYDDKRDLFRIGLTPGEKPAESWYDLMESEERLTGYIAVASKQVPLRHWQRLSRARVAFQGFRGMVSWTGTMFEYLMPELFLPLYENSALWESARFAMYVQRRHSFGPDGLWGTSESAFAALDETGHYRYKAHGIPALALCRGLAGEKVAAPYSSFMALSVAPRGALANLRKMERDEYKGPYGYWEAVDFTPGRCGSDRGTPVRCVMAHHAGMSLTAAANALTGGIVRKWFMSEPSMAAHTALLQEKIPLDRALLTRRPERRDRPVRDARQPGELRKGAGTDFFHPETAPLSNGNYDLLFTESGCSFSRCGQLSLYAPPRSPLEGHHGVELWLCRDGELRSLLPEPGNEGSFRWGFSQRDAVLTGSSDDCAWDVTAEVSAAYPGEHRRVTLRRGPGAPEERLILGFEPVMLPERDYAAQPSFGRLGLFTRVTEDVLTVRRLPRGGAREQYMALACSVPAAFSSDFRAFPGRNGGERFRENTGWQSECFAAASVVIPAGERECRVTFALCTAGDEAAAVSGARAMLSESGAGSVPEMAERAAGLESGEFLRAVSALRALVWPALTKEGARLPGQNREKLWMLGISGDRPIHAVECEGEQSVSAAAAEVRRCAFLLRCGADLDLVLLTDDEGDYRRTCTAALEETVDKLEREGFGRIRSRLHFASLSADRDAVLSAAALWTDRQGTRLPDRDCSRPVLPVPGRRTGANPEWGFDKEDRFRFSVGNGLPPRCWSNILTGGGLGWIAGDAGVGSLWYENARECALIPWTGDPLSAAGPERLFALIDGRPVSFFASSGEEGTVTFGFGEAVWEKTAEDVTLRLTAFIPPDRPVRVMILESSRRVEVRWCAPLQLAPEKEDAPCCRVRREGAALRADNPRCAFPGLTIAARCSEPWTTRTSQRDFLSGKTVEEGRSADPALCGSFVLEGRAVLLLGSCDAPELLDADKAHMEWRRTRDWWRSRVSVLRCDGVGDAVTPLLNGWSAYQALACRFLARGSLYQSGGAVGFRDQLQDSVNLLWTDPALCREHILVCCTHQYHEGDVQHWWHPGPGLVHKGVRTRCSDDLLWLPWALCEYAETTGDLAICGEETPFIASPELEETERSRYELPVLSGERGSVLDHCRRACGLVLSRGVGAHRLLLMGGGDWNDGFDAMGDGAESVWLTWFASAVFSRFGALLRRLDHPEGEKYAAVARMLGAAANEAWDGDRFLRGWYADGTPMGSRESDACRIDSVAQSFAAFCPYADPGRVNTALDTALRTLWDREHHCVALFDPPFGPGGRSPGYISSYGPGFRENGGQYTHAAVWLARACFRTGRWAEGTALLRDIALSLREEACGTEPFVLSADVYTAPGMEGRGGWSWYTGAAGWWYRTAWQDMLGFQVKNGEAAFDPPAPVRARGWRLSYRPRSGPTLRFPAMD